MDDQNVQDNVDQEVQNTETQEIESDAKVQEAPQAEEVASEVAYSEDKDDLSGSENEDGNPEKDSLYNRKFDMWERKLLDLSLRNNLLNIKKEQMIHLLLPEDSILKEIEGEQKESEQKEDKPKSYKIRPLSEINQVEKTDEKTEEPVDLETLIAEKFKSGVLCTDMTRGSLDDKIKDMQRKAKVAEEENGASSLYLAPLFLRWRENGSNNGSKKVSENNNEKASTFSTDNNSVEKSEDGVLAPIILIPCDIVRKSIVFGYEIRLRDDVILNITILEKLKQDFDIDIPEFEGKSSIKDFENDFKDIKDVFGEVAKKKDKWEVVTDGYLGVFSFNKFVLWNDMHSHREALYENNIVKSLVNNTACEELLSVATTDSNNEEDLFVPLSADDTQLNAIKAAAEGKSFVLHGPPGTGKSQTITSMIANCIANDKKVLFVAEKKVALDVVYSRLEKIGIAPFCLELHSNKAKKSHIMNQLRVATEIKFDKSDVPNYKQKSEEMKSRENELKGYVEAMHKRQDCGYSVYELINLYVQNENAPDVVRFSDEFLESFKASDASEIEALLCEMSVARKEGMEELSFVRAKEYSQTMKDTIGSSVSKCREDVSNLSKQKDKLTNSLSSYGVTTPSGDDSSKSIGYMADTVRDCLSCSSIPSYFISNDTEKSINDIVSMTDLYKSSYDIRDDILTRWSEDFLTRDPQALLAEFDEAQGKIAPLRSLAVNSIYKKLRSADKTVGKVKDDLRTEFAKLSQYKEIKAKADFFYDQYRAVMPEITTSVDATSVNSAARTAGVEFAKISGIQGVSGYIKALSSNPAVKLDAEEFLKACDDLNASYSAINDVLEFEDGADYISLSEIMRKMEVISANEDLLRAYLLFNNSVAKITDKNVDNLVDSFRKGEVSGDKLVTAFRKRYAKDLASKYLDEETDLKNFSSDIFEEKVRQFSEADKEFTKITREEIYYRLCKTSPDVAVKANAASALGMLKKAIKSGGRNISIRGLFETTWEVISDLCPCMLMSPMSVAQYIDPEKMKFDVVIFDEASQIPTAEAVGALARGKSAVIVGDPNQMPPTTFFQAMQNVSEDYEIEDMESILDDCLAANIPSEYLCWHYRSHHESLITFSNRSFYDGRLYTFPSADNKTPKVSLVPGKKEAFFDRGNKRINEDEANAVVEKIYELFEKSNGKSCSIGVVTFNIQQQYEIEDKLNEKCKDNEAFENWVYSTDDALFIKNLENVQGDERDIIIFSVAYGPDQDGNIYMNFGPLNKDGGWRRLNVAVTRARDEMIVFSSLKPEDIRITNSSSDGVVAFKRFLAYASEKPNWDDGIISAGTADANNPIIDRSADFTGVADAIIARLREKDYTCDKQIGNSAFKVDIGVCDNNSSQTYKLGILLDGPSYFASKSIAAREVSQPSLLKDLGWKVLRVRVIEWWESPDRVMDEIFKVLNEVDETPISDEDVKTEGPVVESGDTVTDTTEVAQGIESTDGVEEPHSNQSDKSIPEDSDDSAFVVNNSINAKEYTEEKVIFDLGKDEFWDCECGMKGNTRNFCSECGKPRPVVDAETDSVPEDLEGDDVKKN